MKPVPINEPLDGKIKVSSPVWIRFLYDIPNIQKGTVATSKDKGEPGQIMWDADYLYVCIAPNTWKRAGLSTW